MRETLDCAACTDSLKFARRCDKPAENPAELEAWRAAAPDMAPNPAHPKACPRLRVERGAPEVSRLLAEYGAFTRGVLRRPGGLGNQPAVWVQAMHVIDAEMHRLDRAALEDARK